MAVVRKSEPVFYPYGPYELPCKPGTQEFDYIVFKKFVTEKDDWGKEPGCYVICKKATRGLKAIYIGKSHKGILRRIGQHKNMISRVMQEGGRRSKFIIFMLHYEKVRGKWNDAAIDLLETELIALALKNRIALNNIQKTLVKKVRVAGVLNSGPGRKPPAAPSLRKALGMRG